MKGPKWQKIQADKEALVDAIRKVDRHQARRRGHGVVDELDKLTAGVDPTSFIQDGDAWHPAGPTAATSTRPSTPARESSAVARAMPGRSTQPADTSSLDPATTTELGETAKELAGSTKGIEAENVGDRNDPDDKLFGGLETESSIGDKIMGRNVDDRPR